MRFCPACDNMMYISLRADEQRKGAPLALTYACKHCGTAQTADDVVADAAAVLSTEYSDDHTAYQQFVTPYITHDPTLPRVSHIQCPAEDCQCKRAPESVPNEVIFVKYDPVSLKFLYHCVHCRMFWKSGSSAPLQGGPQQKPAAAADGP